jgi:hypothetical protein
MNQAAGLIAVLSTIALACSSSGPDTTSDAEQPAFPKNYRDTYVEVRSCQASGDHNLNHVRVLANPRAAAAYRQRNDHFAEGDVVVKEEFDFSDSACSGAITRWTAMLRSDKAVAEAQGWRWQTVDSSWHVVETNGTTCVGCHASCGLPPDGYEGTCGQQ